MSVGQGVSVTGIIKLVMDPQPQQPNQALSQAPSVVAQAAPVNPVQSSSGSDADGVGLTELDRAYIDKTISAVEETSSDPYSQSQAVNSIRNDYLRERFGKQIDV